jgi:Tfp pilus assembly PilM family ATPase
LPTPGDEQDPNGMPQTPQQLQQVIGEAVQQALQQAGVEFRDREISIKERDAETRRIAVDQDGEHKVLDLAMRNAGGNQLPAGAMP